MRVWRGDGAFAELLSSDPEISPWLSETELAEAFDVKWHFRHVDTIFARVFGAGAAA